jgi:hypothetical protein
MPTQPAQTINESVPFTLSNMPPTAAQTIYELVQVRKNPLADSYNCFSCLGRSSAPQSVKSLSEVFPSLVISFTLSNMPMQSAQTINELVQVIGASLEESLLRFFRVEKLCTAEREIT